MIAYRCVHPGICSALAFRYVRRQRLLKPVDTPAFVQPWQNWDPTGEVEIRIDQEAAPPTSQPKHQRNSRSRGRKASSVCDCRRCCSAPVATFVVFLVLLVIVLAVVARSYAVYVGEAGEGSPGGGNPAEYTHSNDDSSQVCEVTPQLTCTCDGTPVIQVRADRRIISFDYRLACRCFTYLCTRARACVRMLPMCAG